MAAQLKAAQGSSHYRKSWEPLVFAFDTQFKRYAAATNFFWHN